MAAFVEAGRRHRAFAEAGARQVVFFEILGMMNGKRGWSVPVNLTLSGLIRANNGY
jgi:hypothetical protein